MGDVIGLSAEKLPENSQKQKDRKKLILLLLKNWGSLKSEVTRLNSLYNTATATGALSKQTAVKSGKIAATMKGPLGLITIVAAGIVAIGAFLNNKSVEITIKNYDCPPITMLSDKTVDLPGLKLPTSDIRSGAEDIIKIPGVDVNVAIDKSGLTTLEALGINKTFNLPSAYKEIIFDGNSLIGENTILRLAKNKSHKLDVICN